MSTANNLLQTLSDDLAGAVELAGLSIVRVEARRANPASGIIWSTGGEIVTAHHVLEHEDRINVVLANGRELPATIAGRDPGSDLAVLRVNASDLPAITAAPRDEARLGHLILAVGRPLALAATLGVISSIGGPWRTWRGGRLERLIQTDAPFFPGFSGGALVDTAGRLVGIASSQLGRGMNLAVPTDLASTIVADLLSQGRVRRGYLGVGTQPVELPASLRSRLGLEQPTGLLVVTLDANGPADQAGLLVGDILIALSQQAIAGIDELQACLAGSTPGTPATARLIRGGALHDLTVTIGERGTGGR